MKFLSGRFLLTIIGGIVFIYCSFTKAIDGATITAILMMIFQSYFQRTDRVKNGTSGSDKN